MTIRGSINTQAAAWAGRVSAELRAVAIRARIASYETAVRVPSVAAWSSEYQTGHWDYLGGIDQLARYSILAGYCDQIDHRSILDVGCGTGILRARVEHVDFESYVGVDPVGTAVAEASQLADHRTTFLIGDVFLPGLQACDIVVCNEVLYSLPQPARQLDRLHHLVRPGGHMLTSNIRHPGDVGLYRLIGERFELVDAVEVSNQTKRGRRRRRVAAYRRAL
jgi:2-polyprenyl-3-methyl-5-hydroxy-6-metoxy-1,4-benzoquinol methylase